MDPITLNLILMIALAVSEGLSMIPTIKSNGIFQLLYDVLHTLAGKAPPPANT